MQGAFFFTVCHERLCGGTSSAPRQTPQPKAPTTLPPRFLCKRLFVQDVPIGILTLREEKSQVRRLSTSLEVAQMTNKRRTHAQYSGEMQEWVEQKRIRYQDAQIHISQSSCFSETHKNSFKENYAHTPFIPQSQNLSHDIVTYQLIHCCFFHQTVSLLYLENVA